MITKNAFETLKEEFGDVASWTVWADPDSGTIKSNTDDVTMFDDPSILNTLNNDYIFVGLNAAAHDEKGGYPNLGKFFTAII